ncbi:MAG: LON peptidase substrate-binding domain-containing protein, partial [Planctomycetes bacterium]|nr:LON peptidase substrate-binding domain-containing protein [Planctomycetota bacterium]
MASYFDNLRVPSGAAWGDEMRPDETDDIETYLDEDEEPFRDSDLDLTVPDVLGILPVRNTVVYPGTVTHLAVGRERSKALLKDTEPNETVIGLLTQRNPDTDRPGFGDLYAVGTTASVLKTIKMPQGSINIVVHGIARFRIVTHVATRPYLKARVKLLHNRPTRMSKQIQALVVSVRHSANRMIALSPNIPEEASVLLENIEDPASLADFLAANLSMEISQKQDLLEELDPVRRLQRISVVLAHQLEVLELSHKIQGRVRDSIDKTQREYFLQEQLKAIQTELGQQDVRGEELKEIQQNIVKARMPRSVEQEALRELDRLNKIPPASPEYSVIRTYLDWVCELPWSVQTEDLLDIQRAERILNRDHY